METKQIQNDKDLNKINTNVCIRVQRVPKIETILIYKNKQATDAADHPLKLVNASPCFS